MLLLRLAILYGFAGVAVALAFVIFGAERALAKPAPVSIGARILLVPGAVALWPYVLYRWLTAGRAR
jgi:hypothetical protein